ncbi:CHAT domain-containing protein [Streptomyces sp. DSM 44915]|uniref:CHAT domain-containing protein n=1 Tax=Streptomyces chisholmiae TaxID=3075540 RepID=A0ABU2JPN7_9ACTN|nr:CHAT domain-containing protein [Streptomyces sp. DSM 44915]MDT0266957.1 CHAT domain-containing protein [Streptomyces sp. DSM 44915]
MTADAGGAGEPAAVAALLARLARHAAGDRSAVLGAAAEAELRQVTEHGERHGYPPRSLVTLGRVRLTRFRETGEPAEYRAAALAYEPLWLGRLVEDPEPGPAGAAPEEIAGRATRRGGALLSHFLATRDPEQLLPARAVFDRALTELPTTHRLSPVVDSGRAHVFLTAYQYLRWRDALPVGLRAVRGMLSLPSGQLPASLGHQLLDLHQQDGAQQPFELGVEALVHSLGTTPPPPTAERLATLVRLTGALLRQLGRTGDTARTSHTADRVAELLSRARPVQPAHRAEFEELLRHAGDGEGAARTLRIGLLRALTHPPAAPQLRQLGRELRARHAETGDAAALAEAIGVLRAAVDAEPTAAGWAALANALSTAAAAGLPAGDPGEAVEAAERALALAPEAPEALSALANALTRHPERRSDPAAVTRAVELHARATELLPDGHPAAVHSLLNTARARAWLGRLDRTTEPLDRAVAELRAARTALPADHPHRGAVDLELAALLLDRDELDPSEAALTEALGLLRGLPAPRAPAAGPLLLRALRLRHQRRGADSPESLDEALALALPAGPPAPDAVGAADPDWTAELAALYQLRPEPVLLAELVPLARRDAEAAGPGAPRHAPARLLLGRALVWRYEAHLDPAALTEGAALLTGLANGDGDPAVARAALAPATHARRLAAARLAPAARAALATGSDLFAELVTTHLRELDEVVRLGRAAVATHPEPGRERGEARVDLALALLARAEFGEPDPDLAEAVALLRSAIDDPANAATPQAGWLVNLSVALRLRYAGTGNQALLAESLVRADEALAGTRPGQPERLRAAAARAAALADRYRALGDPADGAAAQAGLQAAADTAGASLPDRLSAAGDAARVAVERGDFEAATGAYETAVALLPELVGGWLAGDPAGRRAAAAEAALGAYPPLAAEGASCALRLGQPDRALRLLERGRGVLLGQALTTRRELAGLRAGHPALAVELADLAADSAAERPGAATRLAELLTRIRARPGLAGFLAPAGPDPARLALPGPTVVVNLSRLGAHALLLADGRREVLPLPRLDPRDAVRRCVDFLTAAATVGDQARTAEQRRAAGEVVRATLGWLWTTVAEPVLTALELPRTDRPPRLWWCPTGPLTGLPFHAAGDGRDAVPDHVVSSYTATLAALGPAEPPPPKTPPPAAGRLLVVDAAHATDEVRALTALFPTATVLAGPAATRAAVRAALPDHDRVHFACHATVDPVRRLTGRLVLADGTLAPHDLAELELPRAELAVLAACASAAGSLDLQDEAQHLATACQLAGYRQVIATLWPITTPQAAVFARLLHTHLDRGAPPALALHRTAGTIRRHYPDRPWLWSPYLHLGR